MRTHGTLFYTHLIMFKVLMLVTACVVHVAAMPTAPRARLDLPVCNVDRDPECVHMDSIKELYFDASSMTAHTGAVLLPDR